MAHDTKIAGVQEGDVLAGKYRVDRVLGVGGMGVVVAAHHVQLDDRVAIKFLLPETLGNAEAIGRFAREARAAVKIKNEHVARVSDVGTLENGAPYMVMEYLEGSDLAAWVHQKGPMPAEQAVEFVLQACEAIAEAHGLGIVHRDLKPANLFCIRRADGQLCIKVLDFGISKVTSLDGSGPDMSMTKTSAVMGSPLYMSPEQMESSRSVDARTDIWAIGVILYELITGKGPFNGESLPEVCVKIATHAPPPMRNRLPDTPAGLERIIVKCLEKDRTKRYLNVAELAVALLEYGPRRSRASVERISGIIQGAGLSASAVALPPSSDDESHKADGGTMPSWGGTSPGAKRGTQAMGGVVAVLVVAGVVGGLWMRGMRARSSADLAAGGAPSALSLTTTSSPSWPAVAPALAKEPVRELPVATTTPSAEPPMDRKEPARSQPHPLKKPSTVSSASPPTQSPAKPPRAETRAAPADDIGRFLTDPK